MAGHPDTVSYDDFVKLDLRIGRIVEATDHPQADRLLVLKVDLGTERRTLCAGLKGHYPPDDLVGTDLVMVANLAPRMMRGIESQGMLLAASNEDQSKVVLLTPREPMPPGSPVS